MSKIDKELKKIAAGTSKASSPITSSTKASPTSQLGPKAGLLGDPECPICGGIGYVRLDVPVSHPDFGRLQVCTCRQSQVSRQIRQRLFALSNLDELSHLTFENFQPRGMIGLSPRQADSLEQAHNHARQYAQSLKGWLLLQGGYGCGKTHLAAAIANFAVGLGVPTLFITVPDLLDTLRFAYDDPEATFEQRFDEIRQAPLLVMDDFGTQNATSWAQEKLFQILNYRYINHLPLVITTNLPLDDIEPRIRSRLMDPQLVTRVNILAPDFRNPTEETGLGVLHESTFATFDLRKKEGLPAEDLQSLEKALKAARSFAEHPEGWFVLIGGFGCGKTHLAAAIANYRSDLGYDVRFAVVPDLLDHLRATFNPGSTVSLDRRFEQVRTCRLLILDDLGTQSMTPWVREKLYQLFNFRYNHKLPTVITTADSLEEIDPRIRSRMMDSRLCKIYGITVPAYAGSIRRQSQATARKRRVG
jgi:DNA replication protein DnaC